MDKIKLIFEMMKKSIIIFLFSALTLSAQDISLSYLAGFPVLPVGAGNRFAVAHGYSAGVQVNKKYYGVGLEYFNASRVIRSRVSYTDATGAFLRYETMDLFYRQTGIKATVTGRATVKSIVILPGIWLCYNISGKNVLHSESYSGVSDIYDYRKIQFGFQGGISRHFGRLTAGVSYVQSVVPLQTWGHNTRCIQSSLSWQIKKRSDGRG